MEPDDAQFFETVMQVVHRYGMKRTTMAELAQGAGLSRQTLYDRFGDKDGVMAATVDFWAERMLADLRAALAERTGLAEKLDAYFDVVIWPTYDVMQRMPDAADFESGMGPKSVAVSEAMSETKRHILAEMLTEHLPQNGQSPEDVAAFFEQSSSRAKMSGLARDELGRFLSVLKASVLGLAR